MKIACEYCGCYVEAEEKAAAEGTDKPEGAGREKAAR